MEFPSIGKTYSLNSALLDTCTEPTVKFVKRCHEDSSMSYRARYIGSLVADFHRNLIQGGIYIYPSLREKPNGKLRILYECSPLSFIAEAGGLAIHDGGRIMMFSLQNYTKEYLTTLAAKTSLRGNAGLSVIINNRCAPTIY